MRSAVIFAALAVGTCARVIEKEVYVTEWTTTTVTETVTQWPTNTPSTAVLVKQDHTKTTNAALPTVDVAKKAPAEVESAPAAASTTTAAAPTTAAAVVESEPSSSTTSSTTSSSTTEAELKTVSTAAPVTTSVATSSATSTTAAATAASSAGSSYQESILHYHNLHRSDHSASGLTWSEDLAGAAKTLASRCEYGHDT